MGWGTTPVRRPPRERTPLTRRRLFWLGLLLLGIALAKLSELWFAVGGWSRLLQWSGGMLLGLAALVGLAVLGWRSALAGGAVVVLAAYLLSGVEPALRDASFRMFVREHRDGLTRAVGLLKPVRMTQRIRGPEPQCARLPGLRPADCAPLVALLSDLGVSSAWREGPATVFETYGMLDARGGILHCPPAPGGSCARRNQRHLEGDWYRWWLE